MKALALLLASGLLVGSITMSHDEASATLSAAEPVVKMGALASGSAGGLNGSLGSASVSGALLATTTNVLYLNNTGSSTWYARLNVTSSSGVAGLSSITLGIDNGTRVAQAAGTLGSLTQTGGSYVALAPGSANKLYVTQAVSLLGNTASFSLDVYASDATDDSAYVVTHATIGIT